MRNELHHIEQIEKYLNGEMTSAEISIFEENMKNNLALREQVQTQQLVMQAAVRKALKADIAKYGTGVSGGFNWTKWLGISVGVIVIALISYFTIFSDDSTPAVEKESVNNSKESPKSPEIVDITSPIDSTEVTHSIDSIPNIETGQANDNSTNHHKKYDYPEDTQCGGLKTWVEPDKQITKIDPKKGATIEGKEGTLVIVPSDAFVDDNGNLISEEVELELVEALKISDMLAYNLSTMNDDNVLQSGGMIYVQPTVAGKKVNINPDRPLYIEIPTDDYNPDMKAWEGEVDANGDINWKNPKELEKYLTIVNFEFLDFLPNGFEETVAAGMPFKSYKKADKELVDSLYYSLGISQVSCNEEETSSCNRYDAENEFDSPDFKDGPGNSSISLLLFDPKGMYIKNASCELRIGNTTVYSTHSNEEGTASFQDIIKGTYQLKICNGEKVQYFNEINVRKGKNPQKLIIAFSNPNESTETKWSKTAQYNLNTDSISKTPETNTASCYISPQSVQTIKSDQFSQTFLSTKEFEQRIKILHQMHNAQELFDLYVNNLEKNLWEVDEMVANKLNGADKEYFTDFAAEQLTNVKGLNIYQDQLSAYYSKKKKEYLDAAKKANAIYQQQSTAQLKQHQYNLSKLKSEYANLNTAQLKLDNDNSNQNKNLTASTMNAENSTKVNFKLPKLNLPVSSKSLPKTNTVTSNSSYATKWYSSGWMNIDAYLHELEKGSKTVDIEVKDGKGKIYQCLNTLKTIIPLTIAGILAKAKFPKWGTTYAIKMNNTFAIGIRKENGQLQYAEQYYNPYQTSKITMNWVNVSSNELKEKLAVLDGTGPLLKEIAQQEAFIQKQLEIKQKKEELEQQKKKVEAEMNVIQEKIKDIEIELAKERAFITSLEMILNKCGVAFPVSATKEAETIEKTFSPTVSKSKIVSPMDGIYWETDVMPEFPGGEEALNVYIEKAIIYPESAISRNIEGTVMVKFYIDTTGKVCAPEIIKYIDPALDKEALRVVNNMPKWEPGTSTYGRAVNIWQTLPINFSLKE